MTVVKAKPTSPGRRFRSLQIDRDIHKGRPLSSLTVKKNKTGGRNNAGRITTRHIGGGHKQHYRLIDFKRNKDNIPAKVERIEYDPNRSAFIASLRLKSGEVRKVLIDCKATIGEVSTQEHSLRSFGKAGAKRWLGIRPTVRGVAMNPIDHPHGGGEGKTSGGRHPVSPWGVPTKGYRTRNNKRTDSLILRRRKK